MTRCINCGTHCEPVTERIRHWGTGNEMPGPWAEYIERCPACGAEWEGDDDEQSD